MAHILQMYFFLIEESRFKTLQCCDSYQEKIQEYQHERDVLSTLQRHIEQEEDGSGSLITDLLRVERLLHQEGRESIANLVHAAAVRLSDDKHGGSASGSGASTSSQKVLKQTTTEVETEDASGDVPTSVSDTLRRRMEAAEARVAEMEQEMLRIAEIQSPDESGAHKDLLNTTTHLDLSAIESNEQARVDTQQRLDDLLAEHERCTAELTRITATGSQTQRLETALKDAEKERGDLQSRLAESDSQLAGLKADLERSKKALVASETQIQELMTKSEERVRLSEEETTRLRARSRDLSQKAAEAESAVTTLEGLRGQLSQLKEELHRREDEAMVTEQSLREQLELCRANAAGSAERLDSTCQELERIQTAASELASRLSNTEGELSARSAEAAAASERACSLNSEVTSLRTRMDEMETSLAQSRESASSSDARVSELTGQLEETSTRLVQTRQQYEQQHRACVLWKQQAEKHKAVLNTISGGCQEGPLGRLKQLARRVKHAEEQAARSSEEARSAEAEQRHAQEMSRAYIDQLQTARQERDKAVAARDTARKASASACGRERGLSAAVEELRASERTLRSQLHEAQTTARGALEAEKALRARLSEHEHLRSTDVTEYRDKVRSIVLETESRVTHLEQTLRTKEAVWEKERHALDVTLARAKDQLADAKDSCRSLRVQNSELRRSQLSTSAMRTSMSVDPAPVPVPRSRRSLRDLYK
eukprot:gnl/Dysnectes_brevis/8059_a14081_251.p1 GENE.gnl/Dysnectes_brevis/8059_a14081_251~~gnl/Dysnectes_brevis/8059_a14081_251.p1  ORF type:complete len:777 (+),score=104.73 gnl/Dysnectes_brevis/8059_a14081_251:186-2333(+)